MRPKITKKKPLLPTLREKKRYVCIELHAQSKLPAKDIAKGLQQAFKESLGTIALSKAGILQIGSVSWKKDVAHLVFKVRNTFVDHIRATMVTLTHIDRTPVLARVTLVTGMIAKAKKWSE